MSRFFWLTAILILVMGCAKDIIVKPPSSLAGLYNGEITITKNANTSNPGPVNKEWIEWTFSDQKFWMKAIRTDERPQVFCDVFGNYTVTDKITTSQVSSSDPFTCELNDYPIGTFSLITRAGDTLDISGMIIHGDDQRALQITIWKVTQ